MQLAAISSIQNEVNNSSNLKKQTLDQEDFLKLLVAQLQNQDPMKPMENAEFIGQMAQFSQLEETYNINGNLDGLTENVLQSNNFLLASLIGKNAVMEGSKIHLQSENGASLKYKLLDYAPNVQINIYDQEKHNINTLTISNIEAGLNETTWDGKDMEGQKMAPGKYSFEVIAWDDQDYEIKAYPCTTGKITEVSLIDSPPTVEVDGEVVPITSIMQIQSGEEEN